MRYRDTSGHAAETMVCGFYAMETKIDSKDAQRLNKSEVKKVGKLAHLISKDHDRILDEMHCTPQYFQRSELACRVLRYELSKIVEHLRNFEDVCRYGDWPDPD